MLRKPDISLSPKRGVSLLQSCLDSCRRRNDEEWRVSSPWRVRSGPALPLRTVDLVCRRASLADGFFIRTALRMPLYNIRLCLYWYWEVCV